MNNERIQSLSRALIFLGVMMVATTAAGLVAGAAEKLLFGSSLALVPGGPLPTAPMAWWQLHFQNFFSQAVGFGGAVLVCRALWNGAVPHGWARTAGSSHPLPLLVVLGLTIVTAPLMAASYELNVAMIPEGGLLESIFKPIEELLERLTSFLVQADGARRVVVILSVAALPALFEELAFRGVLQPLLIKATGRAWLGIALASIMFSAIHFQFYGFLPRVLLGALFGWLAWRSGSLLPGMVAHFLNNTGAVITLWSTGSMTEDLFALEPWIVGMSLVLTVAGILAYDRLLQPRFTFLRGDSERPLR